MVKVTESNPNAFKEFDLKLKELEKFMVKVGFFDSAQYPDGTPVAYIATIQELGYKKIPARPFMRPAAIKHEQDWYDTAGWCANQIMEGKIDAHQAMELLGERVKQDIQQAIEDVKSPPLSKITLGVRKYKREGKTVTGKTIGEIARLLAEDKLDVSGVNADPLKDTGLMINSVDFKVEDTK